MVVDGQTDYSNNCLVNNFFPAFDCYREFL
jgi:hypothetical protein